MFRNLSIKWKLGVLRNVNNMLSMQALDSVALAMGEGNPNPAQVTFAAP
jgi:hypothetical protein